MQKIVIIFTFILLFIGKYSFAQFNPELYKDSPKAYTLEERNKIKVKLDKKDIYSNCNNEEKRKSLKKCLENKISLFITTKLDSVQAEFLKSKSSRIISSLGNERNYVSFTFKTNNEGKVTELHKANSSKIIANKSMENVYKDNFKYKSEVFKEAVYIILNQLDKLKLGNISGSIKATQLISEKYFR